MCVFWGWEEVVPRGVCVVCVCACVCVRACALCGWEGGCTLWAVETCQPAVEVSLALPVPELGAVLPLQAVSSSCNIITRGAASTGCGP